MHYITFTTISCQSVGLVVCLSNSCTVCRTRNCSRSVYRWMDSSQHLVHLVARHSSFLVRTGHKFFEVICSKPYKTGIQCILHVCNCDASLTNHLQRNCAREHFECNSERFSVANSRTDMIISVSLVSRFFPAHWFAFYFFCSLILSGNSHRVIRHFSSSLKVTLNRHLMSLISYHVQGGKYGHLQMALFPRRQLDSALEYVRQRSVITRHDDEEVGRPTIYTTGVGCTQHGKLIANSLNVKYVALKFCERLWCCILMMMMMILQ